jgi:hypothetical protein
MLLDTAHLLIVVMVRFVSNTIATTFMLLNLNPVMSVMFNVPAAVASTVRSHHFDAEYQL